MSWSKSWTRKKRYHRWNKMKRTIQLFGPRFNYVKKERKKRDDDNLTPKRRLFLPSQELYNSRVFRGWFLTVLSSIFDYLITILYSTECSLANKTRWREKLRNKIYIFGKSYRGIEIKMEIMKYFPRVLKFLNKANGRWLA